MLTSSWTVSEKREHQHRVAGSSEDSNAQDRVWQDALKEKHRLQLYRSQIVETAIELSQLYYPAYLVKTASGEGSYLRKFIAQNDLGTDQEQTRRQTAFSMARTATHTTPIRVKPDQKKTITPKNLGDKATYFDEFLSNPEILKNYSILSHIGKGAFSVVSLAIQKESHQSFAIKTYEKVDSLDWARLESIKRQIRNLQRLKNDRIVKLMYVTKERKKICLIMENGGKSSLGGLLRKEKSLKEADAKKYFKQILQGVQYIHEKGVCHRDLKPQNILLDQNNNVKIIDFGFSASSSNQLTTFCGTPTYMCPQLTKRQSYNGAKADIWALGILLFLMLVGKHPFRAGSEQELYRLIGAGKYKWGDQGSDSVKRFVARMLSVKLEDRPTASQLLQDSWLQ